MKQWSAMTKAAGIESYYWFSPIVPRSDADLTPLAQVMSAEDEAALQKLRAAKDPKKGGYQFGGEPLPDRRDPASPDHDVLLKPPVVLPPAGDDGLVSEADLRDAARPVPT